MPSPASNNIINLSLFGRFWLNMEHGTLPPKHRRPREQRERRRKTEVEEEAATATQHAAAADTL